MKIFKFGALFLVVALLIIGSILFLNKDAFKAVFENRESIAEGSEYVPLTYSLAGLVSFTAQRSDLVTLVSFTPSEPDSGIFLRRNQYRTMGEIQDFLLLAEYVRQKQENMLTSKSMITVADLKRYQAGAYYPQEFEQFLPQSHISVDSLVRIVVKSKSPAYSDALIAVLGSEQVQNIPANLDVDTEAPIPFLGMAMQLKEPWKSNNLNFEKAWEYFELVRSNRLREDLSRVFENSLDVTFREEAQFYSAFPKANMESLALLLSRALNGQFMDAQASATLISLLEYSNPKETSIGLDRYGAIFNTRMGQLSGIDFGQSSYTGETFVQALSFDNIPLGLWFHMSSNFMNQDLQQRLIWDPGLRIRTQDTLAVYE